VAGHEVQQGPAGGVAVVQVKDDVGMRSAGNLVQLDRGVQQE
jgi:hypothetical protein